MNTFDALYDIHTRWQPHPGQLDIGKALIVDKVKDVFVQAGRNFGKSELVCYLLWRWAIENPGSENYYFAPFQKQAREILWSNRRIQWFGPKELYAGKPNDTEMRIKLTNGSFIKLDGSDNIEAYRGVKPRGLSVLDELKDFHPMFLEAYDPNRAAHQSPMIMIGTPSDREGLFTKQAELHFKDPTKRFFKMPTATNPHLSKEWLEAKRQEFITRGEYDVWIREYEAEFVKGGASKIFPMLTDDMRQEHHKIMLRIRKDMHKLEWIVWADPGAATTFAVLFCAYNPYTKELFLLDEIYEQNQMSMTTNQIGSKIKEYKEELNERANWRQGYDEAATWFANEMLEQFQEHFEPTQKMMNKKELGLTLIKDMLLKRRITISDRCHKTFWEMDNYFKDRNGKIPKINDHQIDNLRYILGALFYGLTEEDEPKLAENKSARKLDSLMSDSYELTGDYSW